MRIKMRVLSFTTVLQILDKGHFSNTVIKWLHPALKFSPFNFIPLFKVYGKNNTHYIFEWCLGNHSSFFCLGRIPSPLGRVSLGEKKAHSSLSTQRKSVPGSHLSHDGYQKPRTLKFLIKKAQCLLLTYTYFPDTLNQPQSAYNT